MRPDTFYALAFMQFWGALAATTVISSTVAWSAMRLVPAPQPRARS